MPRSEITRIQGVIDQTTALAKAAKADKQKNMLMGAIGGFVASKFLKL